MIPYRRRNDNTMLHFAWERHCLPVRSTENRNFNLTNCTRTCAWAGARARVDAAFRSGTSRRSSPRKTVSGIDGWNVTIKVSDRSLTAFSHPFATGTPRPFLPSRSSSTLAHNLYYDRGAHIINLIKRSALKIVLLVRQLLTAGACPLPPTTAVSLVRFLHLHSSSFVFSSGLRHQYDEILFHFSKRFEACRFSQARKCSK